MNGSKVKVEIKINGDSRKNTCWAKSVKAIDFEKIGGYMFEGDFLRSGETMLAIGSVVLKIETNGSWKHHSQYASIGVVKEDGEIDWIEKDLIWSLKKVSIAEKCLELIGNECLS